MNFLELPKNGRKKIIFFVITVLIFMLFSQFIGIIPVMSYLKSNTAVLPYDQYVQAYNNFEFTTLGLNKNIGLSLMLLSFIAGLAALLSCWKYIHGFELRELINTSKSIRWRNISFGILCWGSMLFILTVIEMLFKTDEFIFQFDPHKFTVLFLICIFLLPLQTTFEELVFRSYYLKFFAKFTKIPIIPIVATSLLFAFVHMWNPEVIAYGWPIMFSYYFIFGFALALLTIWDNGIEIALGVHAINNIFSALTVTYSDAVIETDAIWRLETNEITWMHIGGYLIMAILLVTIYFYFFKKK